MAGLIQMRYALVTTIFVPLLIGLGLRTLSVSPNFVPSIKYLIRKISMADAEELASDVMTMGSPDDISDRIMAFYHSAK